MEPDESACDAFVDELRQEVNSSLAAEKDVSEAFRQLCSVQISLDSIKSLPAKVLSVYLHAKFDERVREFVTSSLAELDILPNSMRNISVANLTGLSEYEVIVVCVVVLFLVSLYASKPNPALKLFGIQPLLNDVVLIFIPFTGFSSLRSLFGCL